MFHQFPLTTRALLLILGAGSLLVSPTVRADLIRLSSGGEIRGDVPRTKGATSGPEVKITTLAGTEITVAQEQIDFVTRRPRTIEEYETLARRTPNTVEDQWELAEWCRENHLRRQRAVHLEQIIQLDPDHEQAHYGLKHTKVNGVWMTRAERMQAQGYVKHKGRWMTPQELELTQKTDAERERETEWFRKVHLWKRRLTGTHAGRSRDAQQAFADLEDPDAVSALVKHFQEEDDKRLRRMYVSILDNIPGPKPVEALVAQSLHDADYQIRSKALNAISPEQYETATPLYLRELKHELNVIVRRAAKALERMADDRVVPQLIEALVTKHRYRVRVPEKKTPGFAADGSGMVQGGAVLPPDVELALRSGQISGVTINEYNPAPQLKSRPRFVTVEREKQNREVLAALKKITGQNFGYNERTWKLWHTAQKNGAGHVPVLP